MKRKQKKIIGFFGLVMVVAVTFFAAALPSPETVATTGITDTVTVKVVNKNGYVDTSEPKDGSSFVNPNQMIVYNYGNSRIVTITIEYKGSGDDPIVLMDDEVDYAEGAGLSLAINLDDYGYGYGDYIIRISGENASGAPILGNSTEISYYPLTADAEQDSNTEGQVNVDLNYDQNNSDIDKLVLNVYDKNGNLIEGLSPTEVTPPTTKVPLDFGKYGLESGDYTIEITAYDANGAPLHTPYVVVVNYKVGEKPAPDIVPVPDTGGIFRNANISTADYLITGIIIFTLVAIAGIMFVAKDNKKTKSKSSRRR